MNKYKETQSILVFSCCMTVVCLQGFVPIMAIPVLVPVFYINMRQVAA